MTPERERWLRVLAVVRSGWTRGLPEGWRLVEEGPLAAAVRADPTDDTGVRGHVRRVESLMRELPLVPVPPGLVADDEAAVRSFLRRARLPLLEALELCEGCWELRVHLGPAPGTPPGEAGGDGSDARTGGAGTGGSDEGDGAGASPPRTPPPGTGRVYGALRRRARAVRPLTPAADAFLSAAFLVPRSRWIEFVQDAARREGEVEGLEADVTGPWAPWDFVRMFAEEDR